MSRIIKTFRICFLPLVFLALLTLSGCEGTESREQVDDTVKELSGQKKLEQMDRMKKNIGNIEKQQADRLKEPQ
jgi:hypothetical protein